MAVVQFAPGSGTPEQNAERGIQLVRAAAARGARYVLFPEFAFSSIPAGTRRAVQVPRRAQPVPGPLTSQFQEVARELDVNIAFGMIERRGARIHNSMVFLEPQRIAGVYAKRHPIRIGPPGEREADLYAPGTDSPLVDWGGIRTGVLICADSGDERLWSEIGQRAQLIVWPKSSFGHTADGVSPRARQFRVPIVVANATYPDSENRNVFGESRIVDAKGVEIARAGAEADAIIVADLRIAAP
jgi:predicted amidohydrolase